MKFFKTLIAATLGTFLALALIAVIMLISIASSSQEAEPYVRSNSVLKISLSGSLPAQTPSNPLDELFNQNGNNKVSLQTLKENLDKAKVHDNISGVWLEIDFVSEGWANLQEAHRVISTFRDSTDKFVYAGTNDIGYNEKGYYLATAADSIFSPPETFFEFDGFYSQVMFLDGLFKKLGIQTETTRHGKYKGAIEPLNRQDLSEENEYQLTQLVNQASSTFLEAVSAKSDRSIDELNSLLNGVPNLTSQFAFRENLIDSLIYEDELENYIKKRIGLGEDRSLQTISNSRYAKVSKSSAGISTPSTSDKIAVIYANGPIMPEMNSSSPFDSQPTITKKFFEDQLEDVREDGDVKALVVRINSPGGSGSTSDLIWRMLGETKKEIPVIASMGGVAASGGYYIAMPADSIVAEENTITGSIGVFATKFNTQQLFNEKLGITFDDVKSHEHADWLTQTRSLTPAEEKAFQQYVDDFYQTFITKAAQDRKLSVAEVDEAAQGRVWTGADAMDQGLVDVLGGMDKALELAAEKAGITEYRVESYPKPKTFYEVLMGSAGAQAKALLGETWFVNPMSQEIQDQLRLMKQKGALALFPFEINIQ